MVKEMAEELFDGELYTLTDDEGNENDFELIGKCVIDGVTYLALVPDEEDEEYVILKCETDEEGADVLVTIDDDDEFERVASVFDDEIFSDIDYDEAEDATDDDVDVDDEQ